MPSCICPENFKLNSSTFGFIFRTKWKSVFIKERTNSFFRVAMRCPNACRNVIGLPFLSVAKERRNIT